MPVVIPRFQNSVANAQATAPRVSGYDVGIGKALKRLGNTLSGIGEQELDRQISVQTQYYLSEFANDRNTAFAKAQLEADETGEGFTDNYIKSYDEAFDNFIEAKGIGRLRGRMQDASIHVRQQNIDRASSFEQSTRTSFRKRATNEVVTRLANNARLDPYSLEQQQSMLDATLELSRPYYSPEEYSGIVEESNQIVRQSALRGVMEGSADEALAQIEAGVWSDLDPDFIHQIKTTASNKKDNERVASMTMLASKDPMKFAEQAGSGKFNNPDVQAIWDNLPADDKLSVYTGSISFASQLRAFQDSERQQYEKKLDDASNDLIRNFYSSGDLAERQVIMDQVRRLNRVKPDTLNSMFKDMNEFQFEGRKYDDPEVLIELERRIAKGEQVPDIADFTSLTTSTKVDLMAKQGVTQRRDVTDALKLVKTQKSTVNSMNPLEESQRESDYAEYEQQIIEFARDNPDADVQEYTRELLGNAETDEAYDDRYNRARQKLRTMTEDLPDDVVVRGDKGIDMEATAQRLQELLESGDLDQEKFAYEILPQLAELDAYQNRAKSTEGSK